MPWKWWTSDGSAERFARPEGRRDFAWSLGSRLRFVKNSMFQLDEKHTSTASLIFKYISYARGFVQCHISSFALIVCSGLFRMFRFIVYISNYIYIFYIYIASVFFNHVQPMFNHCSRAAHVSRRKRRMWSRRPRRRPFLRFDLSEKTYPLVMSK